MLLGVGAFAHGTGESLRRKGAEVTTYLTRDYGHYGATTVGPAYFKLTHPSPIPLIRDFSPDVIIPMSIDWAQASWGEELCKYPILCAAGEAMLIERERDFARKLCERFNIPFPRAYVAANRLEAERLLDREQAPLVIKNPLCSPTSPIHTIVCKSVEETRSWLAHLDYAEGVFLQEYLGHLEAGHIVFVSGGEIYSLVTNQEYKRAFTGGMGIVAGAPLGGIVELDPGDKYGLSRELIQPLLPWLREVNFHGPLQVTAVFHSGQWKVIEYNIRMGVTSGPMIASLLKNPITTLSKVVENKPLNIAFEVPQAFGVSITLAGYGYPYTQVRVPAMPLQVNGDFDTDVWWNEVGLTSSGKLEAQGHRIADVVAIASDLETAVSRAYANIKKIDCLGSYYRTDIGRCLWPPGKD